MISCFLSQLICAALREAVPISGTQCTSAGMSKVVFADPIACYVTGRLSSSWWSVSMIQIRARYASRHVPTCTPTDFLGLYD